MRPDLERFCEDTERTFRGRMRSVAELFGRARTDLADAAAVGAATLHESLSAEPTSSPIPGELDAAFEAQYPHVDSLSERVEAMEGDPSALRGLFNGIRGKLFEQRYAARVDRQGLADGQSVELAESPTQPGWDLRVQDEDGDVVRLLQLKASDDAGYLREALERYPDVDIVVPTDVYAELRDAPDLAGRLVDSGFSSAELAEPFETLADASDPPAELDMFPELALVFIGAHGALALARATDPRDGGDRRCSQQTFIA